MQPTESLRRILVKRAQYSPDDPTMLQTIGDLDLSAQTPRRPTAQPMLSQEDVQTRLMLDKARRQAPPSAQARSQQPAPQTQMARTQPTMQPPAARPAPPQRPASPLSQHPRLPGPVPATHQAPATDFLADTTSGQEKTSASTRAEVVEFYLRRGRQPKQRKTSAVRQLTEVLRKSAALANPRFDQQSYLPKEWAGNRVQGNLAPAAVVPARSPWLSNRNIGLAAGGVGAAALLYGLLSRRNRRDEY